MLLPAHLPDTRQRSRGTTPAHLPYTRQLSPGTLALLEYMGVIMRIYFVVEQ